MFARVYNSRFDITYRGLISVGLDLHTTGNSGDGLLSRKIGNVNESVVEPKYQSPILTREWFHVRGKDVGNTKDKLTLLDLRSKGDGGSVFGSDLLWGLSC